MCSIAATTRTLRRTRCDRTHTPGRPCWCALIAISVLTLIGGACGSADGDDAQADGVASLRDASDDDATGGADATPTGN